VTLLLSRQRSHTAPTAENGTASITTLAVNADFVFTQRSAKMRIRLTGRMTFSRSLTRSMFSCWPLQTIAYPVGRVIAART
jgi:hypothetical protein